LEDEEEGASYLADINKVPDFVDEPPVEIADVSRFFFFFFFASLGTDG
jgi:charged multivesicular body protein 5